MILPHGDHSTGQHLGMAHIDAQMHMLPLAQDDMPNATGIVAVGAMHGMKAEGEAMARRYART